MKHWLEGLADRWSRLIDGLYCVVICPIAGFVQTVRWARKRVIQADWSFWLYCFTIIVGGLTAGFVWLFAVWLSVKTLVYMGALP